MPEEAPPPPGAGLLLNVGMCPRLDPRLGVPRMVLPDIARTCSAAAARGEGVEERDSAALLRTQESKAIIARSVVLLRFRAVLLLKGRRGSGSKAQKKKKDTKSKSVQ